MIENKFRLLLTTLGIIVGTITIILVIAIGKGGEKEAAKQFSKSEIDFERWYFILLTNA